MRRGRISVHDVPLGLRITAIRRLIETCGAVPDLFTDYFPTTNLGHPGIQLDYDYVAHSRARPRIVSRGAPPVYVDPDPLTVVSQQGETVRPGTRIGAEEYKDYRRWGSEDVARGREAITTRTAQLQRTLQYHKNWLRAEGLQGIKHFRPPSAEDIHYTELLLCSTTYINAVVTAAWNTAAATAAAAATNLANIRTDIETAITAMFNGCVSVDPSDIRIIMNAVTLGYIEAQAMVAQAASGFAELWGQIQRDTHIRTLFGYILDMRRETYVHPITGASTKYIPDNVVIITTTQNAAIGRELVECEPCHVDAAPGLYGTYISTYEDNEAPGGFRISAEWTGLPVIGVDAGQYIYSDVTAT